ncbi:hypothetical protein GGX14DRAFT_396872 [Mycena pura]|uniref:Uncharacterized protein n=2 Tax=Mycena pura TaxID=153505 RepID=A0AAD6VDD7_9AGAR|nr:hypothetical protein GGX14DRAFT_396872 [Mycena pura]
MSGWHIPQRLNSGLLVHCWSIDPLADEIKWLSAEDANDLEFPAVELKITAEGYSLDGRWSPQILPRERNFSALSVWGIFKCVGVGTSLPSGILFNEGPVGWSALRLAVKNQTDASGARNWIKHKSLGSPNEKCGTCEESNDQAYKARKSEREDRGCNGHGGPTMSTASGRQQGSEVLRNMGADECGEVHPGGRRSKRECCNTAKFPLGTRPGSELIGAEEAERAWPQLVRCAVPYAWCPISEDEDKRENISGEEASLRQDANSQS